MNICVFGSTGKTGLLVVKRALEAGYTVAAFTRSPGKIDFQHPHLSIIEGDALDDSAVLQAVKDSEAVISLLGVSPKSKEQVFTRCITNIGEAMKMVGIKRLIMTAGAGVGDENDKPQAVDKLAGFLLKTVAKNAYQDGIAAAEYIRAQDQLDWTIVRVPMLIDKPGEDTIRIGYLGSDVGFKLSRDTLSAFMVGQLEDTAYIHKAPVISN